MKTNPCRANTLFQSEFALAAIFSSPTLKNIVWADIESLLLAIGCELIEGNGSRIAFIRDGAHPGKEGKSYQARNEKDFLGKLGVEP